MLNKSKILKKLIDLIYFLGGRIILSNYLEKILMQFFLKMCSKTFLKKVEKLWEIAVLPTFFYKSELDLKKKVASLMLKTNKKSATSQW